MGVEVPASCLTVSEVLDRISSWSSEGKVALFGVLSG